MAAGLYSLLLSNALTCLRKPQAHITTPENYKSMKTVYRLAFILIHCVAINLLSGAAMAGIDAGKVYNTWPLMNDQLVPAGMAKIQPLYRNWFENVARFYIFILDNLQ
jgi:cytochrome c oxidase assembly protein subunit 15